MKLMTKEVEKLLPKIGAQEGKGDEAIVYVKYFNPMGAGTWYIMEYDGEDEMFGWADLGDPDCAELGYISLSELQGLHLPFGLGIERDLYWKPVPLKDVKAGKAR